ncbi:hypothetical protein QYF36_013477 [Acer negundo]|nr:hypothetical protein QYF36_013477 [Acer negundo]
MVHKGVLVVIGICVGLALGILIAVLAFFGIRCTSLSNSVAVKRSEYPQKSSQVSRWSNHNKDRHAGLIDDGLVIFNKLVEENKVSPSREHYGCIIDLLARASRLSDASWIAGKLSEGMGIDFWRALLSGCVLHVGRFQDAEALRSSITWYESNLAVFLMVSYGFWLYHSYFVKKMWRKLPVYGAEMTFGGFRIINCLIRCHEVAVLLNAEHPHMKELLDALNNC